MTLTLAVDTTTEFGSIALANDSGVIEEVLLHETNGFSASLFGRIEALLERQGTGARAISGCLRELRARARSPVCA